MAFLVSCVIIYAKSDDPEASVMRDIIAHRSISSLSGASDYIDDNNDGIDDRVESIIIASTFDEKHMSIMMYFARKSQDFYKSEYLTNEEIEEFGVDIYTGSECLSPMLDFYITYTDVITPGMIHYFYSLMPMNKERFNRFFEYSNQLSRLDEDKVLSGLAFKELAVNKSCGFIMREGL